MVTPSDPFHWMRSWAQAGQSRGQVVVNAAHEGGTWRRVTTSNIANPRRFVHDEDR